MLLATLVRRLSRRTLARVYDSLRQSKSGRALDEVLLELDVCQLEERRRLNAAPVAAHAGGSGGQNQPAGSAPASGVLNLDTASHFTAPWMSSPGHGDFKSPQAGSTGGATHSDTQGAGHSHSQTTPAGTAATSNSTSHTQSGNADGGSSGCTPAAGGTSVIAGQFSTTLGSGGGNNGHGWGDFARTFDPQAGLAALQHAAWTAAGGQVSHYPGGSVFELRASAGDVHSAMLGLTQQPSAPLGTATPGNTPALNAAFQPLISNSLADASLASPDISLISTGPSVTTGGNQSAAEGATVSLSGVTYSDPSGTGPHTATIDWGDGTITVGTVDEIAGTVSGSHAYTVVGDYTVTVTVTNSELQAGSGNFGVDVTNVPPTINPIANQTAGVGVSFTTSGITFTDPGTLETHSATINWGDGTPATAVPVSDTITPTGTNGTVTGSHVYATAGIYEATVTVMDSNGGSSNQAFLVIVGNVAPKFDNTLGDATLNVGDTLSLTNVGFTEAIFAGPAQGYTPTLTYTIDWGDGSPVSTGAANITQYGSPGVQTAGNFSGSHVYTAANTYTVTVTISDGLGGTATETFSAIVNNPAPVVAPVPTQTVNEGSTLTLTGATFSDLDLNGSYTAVIDWGDGTATTAATISGSAATGYTIDATHVYGDAITHTATVTVTDLNGGSSASQTFQVVVNDVAPTLTTQPPDVIVAQGATLSLPSIGFTDPTFAESNPSYTPSFTYTINWGDGTPASTGTANIDQAGSAGVLTIGDFTGSHVYTAASTYTVTISINDNEGQTTSETFTVQVVVPVIQTIPTQTVNEGSTLTLTGATFSDPDLNGSYTAVIDWGDGTPTTAATISGSAATGYTIDATHIYGDAITHTATITVTDLNGGSSASQTFQVVVNDVAPTLTTQPPDVIVAQGATLSLPSIGFTDPTFAESNPSYTPSFTYTINWGDGTPASTGTANIDQSGSAGMLTIGDFTGSHVYTAASTYTVTISINDNEGQTTSETFTVQVVVPVIQTIPTQTVNEGSTLTLTGATFSDPDPNGSYTAVIDWGDGTATTAATITPTATPGFFTIDATHIYGDAITHTATVTVTDLNGGSSASQTFQVVVNDVAPTLTTQPPDVIVAQAATLSLPSIGFTDPTFAEPNPSYTPSFTYTIDWATARRPRPARPTSTRAVRPAC